MEESLDISRRDAMVEVEEERQTTESRLAYQQDTPAVVPQARFVLWYGRIHDV